MAKSGHRRNANMLADLQKGYISVSQQKDLVYTLHKHTISL